MSKDKDMNVLDENLERLEEELELNIEDNQPDQKGEIIELIDIEDDDYEGEHENDFGDVEFVNQEAPQKKKKKKSLGNYVAYQFFRVFVMLVALGAFGYASYELTLVYLENDTSFETKDEITNMFLVDVDDSNGGNVVMNSNGETIVLENASDGKAFVWDYQKMLEYNSEAKGYIRQGKGEYIDYPILQHSDNDYYLYHLPDHTWSSMGSIFIDYRIKDGLKSKYCIIYGHYIGQRANNIMFGSLNWYWDRPYYHLEHPDFDIYVEDRHYKYYVYSIIKVSASGDRAYNPNFESDAARLEYLNSIREQSKYEFTKAPELTEDSHTIVLSTCTTDKQVRFLMFLVRGEEIYDVPGVDYENDSTDESKESEEATTEEDTSEETNESTDNDVPVVQPSDTPQPPDDEPDNTDAPPATEPDETQPPATEPEETTGETTTEENTTQEATTAPEETTQEETESSGEEISSQGATEESGSESGTSEDDTTPIE